MAHSCEHALANSVPLLLLLLSVCQASAESQDRCAVVAEAPEDVTSLMQQKLRTEKAAQRRSLTVEGTHNSSQGAGSLFTVTLIGTSGVMAKLAAKIDVDGIVDTVSVKRFAEKTLGIKQLIDAGESCGMLGEKGSSCQAPSAADTHLQDAETKQCCFEWLLNGVMVDSVPLKWKKPVGAISISVTIPSEAGFHAGLSKFLQTLPISPTMRRKLASALWSKGITKERQLAGINAQDISNHLDLPPAVTHMLSQKEVQFGAKDESLSSTLQILRANGLFRGVRIMHNIEETMLGPVVRLSPKMTERDKDALSFSVAFTPDTQSSEKTVEGTSTSKFETLNKVIETAGFSAAASESKGLGFGVSTGGGISHESNALSRSPVAGRLAVNASSFHKSLYFYEPRVLIDLQPPMLEPTGSFHEALDSVVSGSLTVERMFHLYGTHTCPRALLGGWMRYTGHYRSSVSEPVVDMENKVSSAIRKYRDHLPVEHNISKLSLVSQAPKVHVVEPQGYLNVVQDRKGGSSSSRLADWRESLQAKLNSDWRVIDRYQDECIPHWFWVAKNPNLAHTLCHTYEAMRDEHNDTYMLEHTAVTCSEASANISDPQVSSVQKSVQACAEHVRRTHGKAFFIYGKAAATVPKKRSILKKMFKKVLKNSSVSTPVTETAKKKIMKKLAEVYNCTVVKSLDGCSPSLNASADGAWSLYETRVKRASICGPAPPGYRKLDTKAICPGGKYQVQDDYPGSACVPCFTGCGKDSYTRGCGGASPGTCVKCPACPTGSYQKGCGGLSPGACPKCPTPKGPFKAFGKSIVPCKFACYPPAVPQGQSCVVPKCSGEDCKIALKGNSTLALGACSGTKWKSLVLTDAVNCGDDFRPFSFKPEWLGKGDDGKGEWRLRDANSKHYLSIVEKTLIYQEKPGDNDKFRLVPTSEETYQIIVVKTGKCIKAVEESMFQVSSGGCDEFLFVK